MRRKFNNNGLKSALVTSTRNKERLEVETTEKEKEAIEKFHQCLHRSILMPDVQRNKDQYKLVVKMKWPHIVYKNMRTIRKLLWNEDGLIVMSNRYRTFDDMYNIFVASQRNLI
ncbi:hypothetical protein CEXT_110601 [Caerostris extrusa]|uniref:Uncharacterized protein n=1 Tax=Caerostris extrusa TaxID=172846 RepID=A0AAV4MP72_CAEEX|nr:hypothetical protein CEXT_110601 [Caerostris extrusa]